MLAYFIHVTRSDRQYEIARLRGLAQVVFDLLKGLEKARAVNLFGKIRRGDAEEIFFARGEYLGKVDDVGALELTDEIVKQRHRARIGVRLENDDGALVAERFDRVQQRLELARMMGIVVINVRAVKFALELKSSARSGEAGKTVFYRGGLNAEAY